MDDLPLAVLLRPQPGIEALAQKLSASYDGHGFFNEAHPKLRPVETNTAGVYLAGACQAPKDIPATVAAIEYDPNRSARIALLHYADGEKRYILCPVGLSVGDTVLAAAGADIKPGNALPIRSIPVGTMVHNIELKVGKGAQVGRSAGTKVTLMAKEGDWATLRMPSGEMRLVLATCWATARRS